MKVKNHSINAILETREKYRDWYLTHRDPIMTDRMLWRAQSFRHLVHLLPGQTILELGCGRGIFTQQLASVSRGENPITAVTFLSGSKRPADLSTGVEFIATSDLPGPLERRSFNFVIAMDILDRNNCASILQNIYDLLEPGGEVIFYQSNPWNVVLKFRRVLGGVLGRHDPRSLLSRKKLYVLLPAVGFIRVFAVYNDFVYAPLTKGLIWLLRNLSIILENTPGIQTFAGSILVHAQKPPRLIERRETSLCRHRQLHGAISFVIPCRNEEMNVIPLVSRLKALFNEYIHEIILIDDNSTDNTAAIIHELAEEDLRIKPVFRNPPNGVGRALADGYRMATGQYILSMDCDFQHLISELRDLFEAANDETDVIFGSRFSRHSVLLNYPFQKILANRSFHLLAQLILLRRFRDVTNNLKMFRREVVDKLQLKEPGFAVNAETGLQPLVMGCRIKEVPISWINRTPDMGLSSFRVMRAGGGYWRVLWRLFLKRSCGIGAYKSIDKFFIKNISITN